MPLLSGRLMPASCAIIEITHTSLGLVIFSALCLFTHRLARLCECERRWRTRGMAVSNFYNCSALYTMDPQLVLCLPLRLFDVRDVRQKTNSHRYKVPFCSRAEIISFDRTASSIGFLSPSSATLVFSGTKERKSLFVYFQEIIKRRQNRRCHYKQSLPWD